MAICPQSHILPELQMATPLLIKWTVQAIKNPKRAKNTKSSPSMERIKIHILEKKSTIFSTRKKNHLI